jgi:aminoglycoside phosphotransferase (APT) family kinase protein
VVTPAAEVEIDKALVTALLREQHPDLAGAEIRPVGSGWDNALFRVGRNWVVRLPRRTVAVSLLRNELRWLPEIADGLPLPIPVPVRSGASGCGYPWPWSIAPWLAGDTAEAASPTDLGAAADALGAFLAAFHGPAPAAAPANPFRGVPLAHRQAALDSGLARLEGALDGAFDVAAMRARWAEVRDTPVWPGPSVWLHGDVHPLNLLVHRGQLAGVIDFGDLTAGDPASDLAIAWMMFRGRSRDRFRRAAGADDDTWRRALGWALALGVAFSSGDGPVRAIGLRTLRNALADDA